MGPGQKSSSIDPNSDPSSPTLPEDAAAESLIISFGEKSYARRLLESMGWKEVLIITHLIILQSRKIYVLFVHLYVALTLGDRLDKEHLRLRI